MDHTHHDALHPSKADRFWHGVSFWLPFCILQPSLWPGLWQAIALLQIRHWRVKAAWVRLWDEGKAGEVGLQAAVPGGSALAEHTAGNSWILWLLPGPSWERAVGTAPVMATEAGDTVTQHRHTAGTSSTARGCRRCYGYSQAPVTLRMECRSASEGLPFLGSPTPLLLA